ncbi:MAG: RHS repeat-associated core domain-containing protein, partial [Syntrophomonadaceae bacterium]|nr:RHS repeat-associated core domain-containing protein [Syntrophomonadaceae bacterium]
ARYYDPVVGRFLTEDTLFGELDDPLSQNLYLYCANNPVVYVDPTGHMKICKGDARFSGWLNGLPSRLKNQLLHGVWKTDKELTEYEKLVVFSPLLTYYNIFTADLPPEVEELYFDMYTEEFMTSAALAGSTGGMGRVGSGRVGARGLTKGTNKAR